MLVFIYLYKQLDGAMDGTIWRNTNKTIKTNGKTKNMVNTCVLHLFAHRVVIGFHCFYSFHMFVYQILAPWREQCRGQIENKENHQNTTENCEHVGFPFVLLHVQVCSVFVYI